jgi:hypothetical protein
MIMNEVQGNIWDFHDKGYHVCIPTNGFVKKNGCAVMGRGLAKQCKNKFPGIDRDLGIVLKTSGNYPTLLPFRLISFPVKPKYKVISSLSEVVTHMRSKFQVGDRVPGWACKAELNLIHGAATNLCNFFYMYDDIRRIYVPRVGCGNGELQWTDVKPILEKAFEKEDRIVVVSLKEV